MFIGMLSILLTWTLLLMACCGIGFSIQRLLGLPDLNAELVLLGFWLGWSTLIGALHILHLAMPVNLTIALSLLLLGMAGLVWNFSRIRRFLRTRFRSTWSICAVMCIFFIWLANRAMGPIHAYDAGLYHISSVRWISSYPITPGLGNLHGRLAFNSSYFLFQALLDVGPWNHMSHHLAGGLLIVVACLQVGLGVRRVIMKSSRCEFCDILSAVFLIPMVQRSFVDTSSTSPNLPVFILGFVVGSQLCRMLFEHEIIQELVLDTVVITTLCAIGISIKLSFAAFACLSVLVAVGKLLAHAGRRLGQRGNLSNLAWIIVPPILVLVPWMLRSVITSGYPAYPSTMGSLDVKWRVPREQVVMEAKSIRSWARLPEPGIPYDDVLADWDWLVPWGIRMVDSDRFQKDLAVPLLLAIIGITLVSFRRPRDDAGLWALGLLLAPSVASFAYWFFVAPDPRFLGASVWLLGGSTLVWAIKKLRVLEHSRLFAMVSLLLVVMTGTAYVVEYGLVVKPGPRDGFHPIPEAEVYEFLTDSGLVLQVPRERDQCWDAPLPCTPYPKANLRLIRPGEPGSGFMCDPL